VSDEVKKEVEEYRLKKDDDEIEGNGSEEEAARVVKAKAIHQSDNLVRLDWFQETHRDNTLNRAQNALTQTMIKTLDQIEREMKMVGVVMFMGPDPQRAGDLKTMM
jgi:hypothetical protein